MIVIVDTREQWPWDFEGVETEAGTLRSGDYSLRGYEDRVAIERKSLADLYGTLTRGRARFVREMERLSEMEWAAVIVEAGWQEIAAPSFKTKVNPNSVIGSILAFQQRYPVAWLTAGNRRLGASLCLRCLDRFRIEQERRVEVTVK